MQQQMSFLEVPLPAGTTPVWAALDDQERAEVVETLARLMARIATTASAADAGEEKGDE
ncbi:MAG: hypothetical protein FJZ01_28065 [Candidatus Sericytochromatia bacterium]|nr:hypothetical protein [Candidatus Tanganyikabacteria bacterium]